MQSVQEQLQGKMISEGKIDRLPMEIKAGENWLHRLFGWTLSNIREPVHEVVMNTTSSAAQCLGDFITLYFQQIECLVFYKRLIFEGLKIGMPFCDNQGCLSKCRDEFL